MQLARFLGHAATLPGGHHQGEPISGAAARDREHLGGRCRVELLERLVEQQDIRVHGERRRDRHLLPLASGQRVHEPAFELLDAHNASAWATSSGTSWGSMPAFCSTNAISS